MLTYHGDRTFQSDNFRQTFEWDIFFFWVNSLGYISSWSCMWSIVTEQYEYIINQRMWETRRTLPDGPLAKSAVHVGNYSRLMGPQQKSMALSDRNCLTSVRGKCLLPTDLIWRYNASCIQLLYLKLDWFVGNKEHASQ